VVLCAGVKERVTTGNASGGNQEIPNNTEAWRWEEEKRLCLEGNGDQIVKKGKIREWKEWQLCKNILETT